MAGYLLWQAGMDPFPGTVEAEAPFGGKAWSTICFFLSEVLLKKPPKSNTSTWEEVEHRQEGSCRGTRTPLPCRSSGKCEDSKRHRMQSQFSTRCFSKHHPGRRPLHSVEASTPCTNTRLMLPFVIRSVAVHTLMWGHRTTRRYSWNHFALSALWHG
jgi:hypothetical protein